MFDTNAILISVLTLMFYALAILMSLSMIFGVHVSTITSMCSSNNAMHSTPVFELISLGSILTTVHCDCKLLKVVQNLSTKKSAVLMAWAKQGNEEAENSTKQPESTIKQISVLETLKSTVPIMSFLFTLLMLILVIASIIISMSTGNENIQVLIDH